jgi:signal transduction histidine kinase
LLPVDEAELAYDGGCCWHFVAPVDTVAEIATEVQSAPAESIRIGYIHVAAKKGPVQGLIRSIIITNIVVAVILSLLVAGVLLRRIRRLTEPLVALEKVMTDAMHREDKVRAPLEGPAELKSIATVFNDLMEYRDNQSESLESQVKERTQQLEFARDKALKAEREKAEIMAMFTHEMKAPLHAIRSYLAEASSQVDFIRDKETAGRIRQALAIIGVESQELHQRIAQILELRSLESGNVRMDMVEVHIPTILKRVDTTLRPLAMKNANQLEITHKGIETVCFDADKLLQILENLVSNACTFTQKGRVSLNVDCEHNRLVVDVRDSGIGIAPEKHAQVFNAFYQVDMSDTRVHSGTGLGLAIVKRLTDLLGGEVVIDSELGRGAHFRVTLPLPLKEQPVIGC